MPENAHRELTQQIIGAAMEVSNNLGIGYLEKVYENALAIELECRDIGFERQKPISISYKGRPVGSYISDILVEGVVMLELKVVDTVIQAHESQLLNYLRGTGVRIGLILNFGTPRLGVRRLVF